MKNKKERTQTEITNQINKIRNFLFGFCDFITLMDIVLLTLERLDSQEITEIMLATLLQKAENQCRTFSSNISELKRLLK